MCDKRRGRSVQGLALPQPKIRPQHSSGRVCGHGTAMTSMCRWTRWLPTRRPPAQLPRQTARTRRPLLPPPSLSTAARTMASAAEAASTVQSGVVAEPAAAATGGTTSPRKSGSMLASGAASMSLFSCVFLFFFFFFCLCLFVPSPSRRATPDADTDKPAEESCATGASWSRSTATPSAAR